jgi:hypothetical protein
MGSLNANLGGWRRRAPGSRPRLARRSPGTLLAAALGGGGAPYGRSARLTATRIGAQHALPWDECPDTDTHDARHDARLTRHGTRTLSWAVGARRPPASSRALGDGVGTSHRDGHRGRHPRVRSALGDGVPPIATGWAPSTLRPASPSGWPPRPPPSSAPLLGLSSH